MASQNYIYIFDTTLRDGEQSPGCSMNTAEKVKMATQLAKLGVDIIEAGFPVASPGDFESVERIAKEVGTAYPVTIAGLARARLGDITRCYEAVKHAKSPRIHTFLATSEIHMTHKLGMSPKQVIEAVKAAVSHARDLCDNVEFSAEDATRSARDFLAEVFSVAIAAGATTINVPDTVGYTIPSEFYDIVQYLRKHVQNIEKAVISVHCHNDLGLAVANSVAAVQAGARQIECTINGIGERAGNASLEELVMTLAVRHDELPYSTRIEKTQLYPSSKLLSHITGVKVQPNKAIVGDNAFAHEAGIHQDGVLKELSTYEIMTPASVGITTNRIVLGKHSGRHAFRKRLEELGVGLQGTALDSAFDTFKQLADRKKEIYDEDLLALVDREQEEVKETYRLEALDVAVSHRKAPTAAVTLAINGENKMGTATGDGPIDAAFKVIKDISGFKGKLDQFKINAVTGGTDALGEVLVAISENGKSARGIVSDTDIIVAAVRAFLLALNRLSYARGGTTEGV